MTYNEFINQEIERWGEDEVISLINRGFDAVLTTAGWKWILVSKIGGRTNTVSEYSR